MKKVVFIIAQEGFQDKELQDPKSLLEDRGFETRVAAPKKEAAKGKLGGEVMPDLSLDEVKVDDFEAIVFVGGPGAAVYLEDAKAWEIARDFFHAGKIVAAICIAPSILANAGILMGKKVTAFPSEEENIVNKGAEYTGMQVEMDGKIITAKDPSAAIEFGEKIAWQLGE